ncbi:hypothetical protein [Flavobacterium lipolyticum]|uniref:Uncharacterized protein n=1 Tax=Flavobacterium lipolyticum TaxID=2893754 RepID=A0ABS8M1Z6_9FLAO|nr:hypothetical protein [Flavobacterium sp. F-126]MCC9018858.1 hypothetical protein [Flavobacterium sp. F-126]
MTPLLHRYGWFVLTAQEQMILKDVPVVLVTPTTLTVADHGKDMADMITEGITSWMQTNNPQTNAGTFAFMLTAYSVTDSYVPILQIPLSLSLTAVTTN